MMFTEGCGVTGIVTRKIDFTSFRDVSTVLISASSIGSDRSTCTESVDGIGGSIRNLENVCGDGRLSQQSGDGSEDYENEVCRMATYANFPSGSPIRIEDLAEGGFYYTGWKDRVQCYRCRAAIENWVAGDDPVDAKWHKAGCPVAQRQNVHNAAKNRQLVQNRSLHCSICETPETAKEAVSSSNHGTCCSEHEAHTLTAVNNIRTIGGGVKRFSSPTGDCQLASMSEDTEPILQLGHIVSQDHERLIFSLSLNNEGDRRKSYTKWPRYPAPYLPSQLATEGFFYLGNLDRVQCFSCSGILRNWSPGDSVKEQHERHFPHCRMVRRIERRNEPLTDPERKTFDKDEKSKFLQIETNCKFSQNLSTEEARYLEKVYLCRNPQNPHMRHENSRLATFDSRWPSHKIKATRTEIARAGFFYLGNGDRAKCWYCNGGLQNWYPDDDPWVEHAKWFPGCEFVLRTKGQDFVRRLAELHPNLGRPSIRNPASYHATPHPCSSSFRKGFATRQLTRTEMPPAVNGDRHPLGSKSTAAFGTEIGMKKMITVNNKEDEAATEIANLQQLDLCKKCLQSKSDNVCVPCGHFSICSKCAVGANTCIICSRKVDQFVKVYRV